MEATLRLPPRASYADYLAAEQDSDRRNEFIDGMIVAMAEGSDEHNAIAGSLAGLLRNRRTGNCRYYTSDQRFWIASRARGRYADGSIICGAPDHPAHDDQATTNPTVAIEVLSPSSEGDDDGDKPRAEGVAAPRFHSQPCARRRSVRTQPAPLRCALTLRAGPTGPGQPVIFIAPRY